MQRALLVVLLLGCSNAADATGGGTGGQPTSGTGATAGSSSIAGTTGGSAGSQPTAGTSATAGSSGSSVDICREDCETFANCQGFPLSGCDGDIHCSGWPAELWRAEVLTAYQDCGRTCPADPDACPRAAFAAAGAPRAIDNEYSAACVEKMMECERDDFVQLTNDACGEESLYIESAVTAALACLAVAQPDCVGLSPCLDGAFGRQPPE